MPSRFVIVSLLIVQALTLFNVGAVFAEQENYKDLKIWTLSKTKRVLRSDRPKNKSEVFIYSAKNEWESFQILLKSKSDVQNINLIAEDLISKQGNVISKNNSKLYRAHQLYIARGSSSMTMNFFFQPDWYPDALIPFNVSNKKAELRAVPFSLPKDETHGFFIDLYVPANTKPGVYKGIYKIIAGNDFVQEIPVTVKVWDFALPEVPTLSTDFGLTTMRFKRNYERLSGKNKDDIDFEKTNLQIKELLSEHKINPNEFPTNKGLIPQRKPDGSYYFSEKQVKELQGFIDKYKINSIRVGPTNFPVRLVKGKFKKYYKVIKRSEVLEIESILKAFDDLITRVNREVVFYAYLIDEPKEPEHYDYIRKVGKIFRDSKTKVKLLVTEQTYTENTGKNYLQKFGNLNGAVDIWVPNFKRFNFESAMIRQDLGEIVWSYPALGNLQTDFHLMNYRLHGFMSWFYGVKGLLYWAVNHWDSIDDPWTEPYTWCKENKAKCKEVMQNSRVFNGEGVLVYPAHKVGFDGIVPSIRLKAIRDSIEDYEYLVILEKKGLRIEAEDIIEDLFKCSKGKKTRNYYAGDYKNSNSFHKARKKLVELIISKEK